MIKIDGVPNIQEQSVDPPVIALLNQFEGIEREFPSLGLVNYTIIKRLFTT